MSTARVMIRTSHGVRSWIETYCTLITNCVKCGKIEQLFKPPPDINFSTADGANVAEKWRKWKQTMELHLKLPIPGKSENQSVKFSYTL